MSKKILVMRMALVGLLVLLIGWSGMVAAEAPDDTPGDQAEQVLHHVVGDGVPDTPPEVDAMRDYQPGDPLELTSD